MSSKKARNPDRIRTGGSYTIGRDAFMKMSAVEKVYPTADAKRRTSEFDKRGLSPEERRREIVKAYQARR